jgi:hypothetical protein
MLQFDAKTEHSLAQIIKTRTPDLSKAAGMDI